MEVGEIIDKVLLREPSGKLEQEALSRVIDIRSPNDFLLTHRSLLEKSDLVFKEGIVSEDFAHRIKSRRYEVQFGGVGIIPHGMQVWLYVGPKLFKVQKKAPVSEIFGVIVKPLSSIYTPEGDRIENPSYGYVPLSAVLMKNRIAPREFAGCLLPESGNYDKAIRRLVGSMKKAGLPLPIYTTSGDLLWPRRMSHEEIVRMLAGKERPSNARP